MENKFGETTRIDSASDFNPMPVELLMRDPTITGNSTQTLPGGSEERRRLDQVPADLLISRESEFGGWSTTLRLERKNLAAVYAFIYGNSQSDLPGIVGNSDEIVELIGFWD